MNKDYTIRKLRLEDGEKLKEWGAYDSPLFTGYNYNSLTERELTIWFMMKQRRFGSSYFSIYVRDEMIGYIGMKEINSILRSAKLGIVFDSKWTSKGYGTRVLADFLQYFFIEKKMKRLDLEVNSWNDRAINLYKKFGFEEYESKYLEFENQSLDLEAPEFENLKEHFFVDQGKIYSKIYCMKLRRQEYINENRIRK